MSFNEDVTKSEILMLVRTANIKKIFVEFTSAGHIIIIMLLWILSMWDDKVDHMWVLIWIYWSKKTYLAWSSFQNFPWRNERNNVIMYTKLKKNTGKRWNHWQMYGMHDFSCTMIHLTLTQILVQKKTVTEMSSKIPRNLHINQLILDRHLCNF